MTKFCDVSCLTYVCCSFCCLILFSTTGIGNIPDAVLAELTNHKDLGIHSEMFAGGIVDLVHRGCITNNRKTINKGKIIGSFFIGTRALYDFVDNNPYVGEYITSYWHSDKHLVIMNDTRIAQMV